ncbi:hypothetical protein BGZ65_006435 [Modicella reniformis]|uniref:RlpA-like protein double-psi beta-barrel domain-containing protein n=1 Tax=Modicella reniformis TaxID=1440133 RepID=A0A9P6SV13_9FUNG|nr:hypothetical protein BGZ65_006435 [Modicella reniformis]
MAKITNPGTTADVARSPPVHHLELSVEDDKSLPQPPPVPSKKTFYDKTKKIKFSSPAFLERFMARHPSVSEHRRCFVALLCSIIVAFVVCIVVFSVLIARRNDFPDHIGGGSGGSIPVDPQIEMDLRKHNQGVTKPPINRSDAPGWTRQGKGDGTFYNPSERNAVGGFQQGACEFEYINSVFDYIAALNKPDFGSYRRLSRSPACGQCLQVTGPNGTVQVQVVDMCPGCKSGSVDLSPSAFSKIADLDKGRVPISWERCP